MYRIDPIIPGYTLVSPSGRTIHVFRFPGNAIDLEITSESKPDDGLLSLIADLLIDMREDAPASDDDDEK